jgi:hypothetical protein
VEVVFLDGATHTPMTTLDSVFRVHHLPLLGAKPLAGSLLRGALRAAGATATPPSLIGYAHLLDGTVTGLGTLLAELAPSSIVLAGLPAPFDVDELSGVRDARVVAWPLLADLELMKDGRVSELLNRADAIGSLHPGEHAALLAAMPDRASAITPLEVALTLNRPATEQGLFGVSWFGRYVLVIRQFPSDGARFDSSVSHELLRSVLGDVAVAEVDGRKWRVSDFINTAVLPVNPNRVNLWRLMAHATFTVDLRPPGPFGREAVESMLFSSPPIVAEGSAAHAHVLAANGGLWYRNAGEVLDLASTLIDDDDLCSALAANGLRYASEHHEQMATFVTRTNALVLG